MSRTTNRLFIYSDDLAHEGCEDIPNSLKLDGCSLEALTLRLFLGRIHLQKVNASRWVKQYNNYTVLPYKRVNKLSYKIFDTILGVDSLRDEEEKRICDRYFSINRRNVYVHERILNEISWYFWTEKSSPMEGFVHLYRCFEFISYSFPMIYAATSRNYKGTYDNLKKFMDGKDTGEIKFFRNFQESLFQSENMILEFKFDINIRSENLEEIRIELRKILDEGRIRYALDENADFQTDVLTLEFKDVISLLLQMRNRYFHMLSGSGQHNFDGIGYDISDLFRAVNAYIVNWIAVIFGKIVQSGYELAVSYS